MAIFVGCGGGAEDSNAGMDIPAAPEMSEEEEAAERALDVPDRDGDRTED